MNKILMVDIGCSERGCMGVASDWAAGGSPECRPMQEYKEWVGLTDDERMEIYSESLTIWSCMEAVEAKLKEKNT